MKLIIFVTILVIGVVSPIEDKLVAFEDTTKPDTLEDTNPDSSIPVNVTFMQKNQVLLITDITGNVCQYVPADIEYLFHNLQNPTTPIIVPSNNYAAVKKTHFNKAKSTLLLVHGSGGNSSGPLVQKVREAVVKAKLDINVIGVEWQQFQLRNNKTDVRNCSTLFGSIVGNFIKAMMKDFGLSLDNLVIVGHSIAGAFCADIGLVLGNKTRAIVGLETCSHKDRAKFVECIHTCNAKAAVRAHANYFPNGGAQQPHCPKYPDWGCNHWRVIDYYVESLTTDKFIGRQCDTYENFKAGKCNKNPTGVMGGVIPHIANGKFYLDTHDLPPYAKGL